MAKIVLYVFENAVPSRDGISYTASVYLPLLIDVTGKTLQRDSTFPCHLGLQIARAVSSAGASLQQRINHFGTGSNNSGLSSANVKW